MIPSLYFVMNLTSNWQTDDSLKSILWMFQIVKESLSWVAHRGAPKIKKVPNKTYQCKEISMMDTHITKFMGKKQPRHSALLWGYQISN